MEQEQRVAHFQRFIRNNLDQLLAIQDKDEQAKYLVGAVEHYFTRVEPNLTDIAEGDFVDVEPVVVDVTPDPSNDFGEIRVPGT